MEVLEHCLCCGSTQFRLYTEAKDNYSEEKFNIQQCNRCSFVFTNPRPKLEEVGKYYNAPTYMSHTSHSKGFVQSIYRIARNFMKKKKLQLIKSFVQKENNFKLLDFGCGTGDFLSFIQQNHIQATGVEPDVSARKVAKEVNKLEVYSIDAIASIPTKHYDVITLWHVLEHVYNLHEQIALFNDWLLPNGKLIIAVPNIESFDAQKYGKYWDGLDVPRHIYHFSPSCMQQIVEQHQFKLIAIEPLYLDSYYVSMRSEWHRGTPKLFAYFKAIVSGFISNKYAKENGNYSSLIYVFKKEG